MLRVAQWSEEVVPTVAFNFRRVRRGNITLKIWDVAGALLDWALHCSVLLTHAP